MNASLSPSDEPPNTIDLATADIVAERSDDEPYFDIEVVEESVPPLGPIFNKLSDAEAAAQLADSEWERLVKECQELPRGMPLDVLVPGAEIILHDEFDFTD